jgi:hypothetical protein
MQTGLQRRGPQARADNAVVVDSPDKIILHRRNRLGPVVMVSAVHIPPNAAAAHADSAHGGDGHGHGAPQLNRLEVGPYFITQS